MLQCDSLECVHLRCLQAGHLLEGSCISAAQAFLFVLSRPAAQLLEISYAIDALEMKKASLDVVAATLRFLQAAHIFLLED